uniref:CU044_2847 family protein n=1 Tax=Candidatus Roseilinea sp. NK_OTU-006 TaxID=2704250 RepID=UPI002714F2F1
MQSADDQKMPASLDVEFGVSFSGELEAYVAKTGAEGTISVKLSWDVEVTSRVTLSGCGPVIPPRIPRAKPRLVSSRSNSVQHSWEHLRKMTDLLRNDAAETTPDDGWAFTS